MRRLLSVLAAATMLMVGVAVAPTAASAAPERAVTVAAYETNYAVSSGPSWGSCIRIQELDACFEKYGDQWGISAWTNSTVRLQWQNQLWNGSGWVLYREGQCISNLGVGHGVCNKDYYEDSSTNYYGYTGSRLRWQACASSCSSWTSWTYNNG